MLLVLAKYHVLLFAHFGSKIWSSTENLNPIKTLHISADLHDSDHSLICIDVFLNPLTFQLQEGPIVSNKQPAYSAIFRFQRDVRSHAVSSLPLSCMITSCSGRINFALVVQALSESDWKLA